MEPIFKDARNMFQNEILQEGDTWRILGRGTFVDLIKLSFYRFQKSRSEKHLFDILNNCMKIKLLTRIKAIEVTGSLEDVLKRFNKEDEFILSEYDAIFHKLKPKFVNYKSTNIYDLNAKVQYIKVVNQLEIDSYADDVFEEIIGITFNILLME